MLGCKIEKCFQGGKSFHMHAYEVKRTSIMNFIGFHNLCVVLDDRKFGVLGFNNDMLNVLREFAEFVLNRVERNDICIHIYGIFRTPKTETIIGVNINVRVMMKLKPIWIECSKMSGENISDFEVLHVNVIK